jgi:hypothetical protein
VKLPLGRSTKNNTLNPGFVEGNSSSGRPEGPFEKTLQQIILYQDSIYLLESN